MMFWFFLPLFLGFAFAVGAFDFLGDDGGNEDTGGDADNGNGDSGDGTDDLITGTSGDDGMVGTEADDRMFGLAGNDTMQGAEDLYSRGGGGADEIDGGPGDDVLVGETGDTLTGGAGSDAFTAVFDDLQPDEDRGPVLITDFDPEHDSLALEGVVRTGSSYDIEVVDWDDGTGADVYFEGHQFASVAGAQGLSPSDISARIEISGGGYFFTQQVGTDAPDHYSLTYTDRGAQDITRITHFDPATDSITIDGVDGYGEANVTEGVTVTPWADGTGADVSFNGTLVGLVEGGAGLTAADIALDIDTLGAVHLTASDLDDEITSGIGNRQIDAAGGDDQLGGSPYSDWLEGGDGNDTLDGGGTRWAYEELFPTVAPDHLDGGAGDDILHGSSTADVLIGGDGNDVLDGGSNEVTLEFGGTETDQLDGGAGNDVLSAYRGAVMTGGSGADAFSVGFDTAATPPGGEAPSEITDFDPAEDSLTLQLYQGGTVSVSDWADGKGADVLVDGVVVAHVTGGAGLTPADIAVV